MQPAVVQAPNVERMQQQQQNQPQVSQQVFAGHLERIAEERSHQVRETGESRESRAPEDLSEDSRGQPRRRNRRRLPGDAPAGEAGAPAAPEQAGEEKDVPAPGSIVDVRV